MLSVFLATALSVCVAEMGDKTQLLVIGLSAKLRLRDIGLGVVSAVLLLNLIGVSAGSALSSLIPLDFISLAAGLFFLVFSALSLNESKNEQSGLKIKKNRMPQAFSIGIAFFIAELGDKTQLSAIAFSAKNPGMELAVFLGASIGLVIGDAIGVACGILLHKNLPQRTIKFIACSIFAYFGFTTIYTSLKTLTDADTAIIVIIMLALAFIPVMFYRLKKPEKLIRKKKETKGVYTKPDI